MSSSFEPLAVPYASPSQTLPGFEPTDGGVCAAKGIAASGVSAGFRKNPNRYDLALVVADEPCVCAATFTKNIFCAAPVQVSRPRAEKGIARAVILNSGNANAATGDKGIECALETSKIVGDALGCDPEQVLVASTGVIGVPLGTEKFETGVPMAVAALSATTEGAHDAACAVMTTDTVPKEYALRGKIPAGDGPDAGEVEISLGGFVKGSGMIQPNMATMLAVLSTDAPLTQEAAAKALRAAVYKSFNHVTVDSDTSTNDSCFLLATGKAGGDPIGVDSPAYPIVAAAIAALCEELARKIAADGEGATKLVTVDVIGAATEADAETAALSIANSPLVKTAIFGHDANWGRVAAAAGKCGVKFDQYNTDIDLLDVPVLRGGLPVPFDEDEMLERFKEPEAHIVMSLGTGEAFARVWTCDLTHDCVTINGDYRT